MASYLAALLRSVPTALPRYLPADPALGRGLVESVRGVMLSGAAVTVPFLVTLMVIGFVLDFLSNVLDPFVGVLTLVGFTAGQDRAIAEVVTLLLLVGIVFVVGLLSETNGSTRVGPAVQRVLEDIPGVGSVYTSFDRMSEVLLESDSRSFREVKLLEFPHMEVYSLAFLTSEIPASAREDADEPMKVLFVPLAPNPVMGGFMVCVPADRIQDVDMTIQEAFQALVTSGVAMPDRPEAATPVGGSGNGAAVGGSGTGATADESRDGAHPGESEGAAPAGASGAVVPVDESGLPVEDEGRTSA